MFVSHRLFIMTRLNEARHFVYTIVLICTSISNESWSTALILICRSRTLIVMLKLETVPTFSIWRSFSLSTAVESGATESGRVFFNSLSNLANSLCSCFTSVLSETTTLTCALVVTSLAQLAKRSVFLDCSTWIRAGLMVQMMAVLAFPPKEDCNIRVSFESLKGICPFLPLLHQS